MNSVDKWLRKKKIICKVLKENLKKAQERMKLYVDSKRTEWVFEEGAWIYLKLQSYRQSSVAIRRNLKLAAKYYGPYQILRKIGQVAYELKLPDGVRIHPVFHVS